MLNQLAYPICGREYWNKKKINSFTQTRGSFIGVRNISPNDFFYKSNQHVATPALFIVTN
jgi:hypothetical protein